MKNFSTPKAADFMIDLQSTDAESYDMALQVRDAYFNYDPNVIADIKYGGLVFLKAKELIGGIFFYKAHASIEFSEGASLSDPHSVLEGKGKHRRHIKIKYCEDIQAKKVTSYVREALTQHSITVVV